MFDLIARDRRQFEVWGPGTLGARIPGIMTARLTKDGLTARSGDGAIALRTVSVSGKPLGAVAPVLGGCAPTSEVVGGRCAAAAALRHAQVTEWWTSSREGVRQSWRVSRPPGTASRLELRLTLDQGALLQVDADGAGATLLGSGGEHWRYEQLTAWDTSGARLSARLVEDDPGLLVVVDVAQARWPVYVDPLLTPFQLIEGELSSPDTTQDDRYGYDVSGAGDIDGDGYDDVIVGIREVEGHGAAYVYYGTPSGISTTSEVKLTASDIDEEDDFGRAVSGAGDLNGDGYDDVIVGSPLDDENASNSGAVYVYYGTPSGISTTSEDKIIPSDGGSSDGFGETVSSAGDIDGDGFDDIIVESGRNHSTGIDGGAAYVYYGAPSGISISSEQKLTASDGTAYDFFGQHASGAGDINGDGYDDVIAGMPDGNSLKGAAYVYYGTPSGISTSSEDKLTASDGASNDVYGRAVSGAGDLNGDGYDDVIVGAMYDDDSGAESGSAYVYYGTPSGISTSSEEKLIASDGSANKGYGRAVRGIGDINNDGYSDLAVPVPAEDSAGINTGAVYIYYGTPYGISSHSEQKLIASDATLGAYFGFMASGAGDVDGDGQDDFIVSATGDDHRAPDGGSLYVYRTRSALAASDRASGDELGYAVSSAGDVNSDGYDDVLVGAPGDDDAGTESGSAYVYYGTASGVSTSEDKLIASDGAASAAFGHSVSSAGDVNSDGYDDVLVGAPGDGDSGAAYVYYGTSSGIRRTPEDKLTASDGAPGDAFGDAVSEAGDLDGDGYDDVVVGAPGDDDRGAAYVYYGTPSGFSSASESKLTASDGAAGDAFGDDVSEAGDVDGDGYDDLIVGAYGHDDDGAAYVYYGAPSGVSSTSEDKLTASDGAPDDAFGYAVSAAGDIDDDGYDDLIVGAHGHDDDGAAYVYYGASAGVSTASEEKLTASDGATGDAFGYAVSAAGDLDGDGHGDLIIGAYSHDESGAMYVYYGTPSGVSTASEEKLSTSDGAAGDAFGHAVSAAGDIDDDGYDDVIVGAFGDDDDGAAYVFVGACRDADGDASCSREDCNDQDDSIYPGAPEVVGDEIDQDCDGGETCYADADDDGYTDGATTVASADEDCADSGEGLATDPDDDCDDSDADTNPGAPEVVGDEIDQDCDGDVLCYVDHDYDGYTDGVTTSVSRDGDCLDFREGSTTTPTGDCDDDDGDINPGATEVCDDEHVDEDCDGLVNDADPSTDQGAMGTWHADTDGDGYGDAGAPVLACAQPEGSTTDTTDCDDTDASIHPGAAEVCDAEATDEDCNGLADDEDPSVDTGTMRTWHADTDGDGYGAADALVLACAQPEGSTTDDTDCNDTDATIHPGARERSDDGVDQNCDGSDSDDEGHKGCASTGSRSPPGALPGVLAVIALVRRRRAPASPSTQRAERRCRGSAVA